MRKLVSLASLLLAGVMLAGCSGSKDSELSQLSAQELYSQGQAYLEEGDYHNAIRYLESVDARAKLGSYGEQIQLSLIYSNYQLGEYHKSLDEAERFVRMYPTSPSMDYVYFLAGLSNVRLGDNYIQDLFRINDSARAVESVRNAYGSFQALVQQFPQSQYAPDAQQWMGYLLNRLAEHELAIAQFYMERDAYVAVANRVQEMLRFYPETKATNDALPLLKASFEAMNIQDSAQRVASLIEANKEKTFPEVGKPEYGDQF